MRRATRRWWWTLIAAGVLGFGLSACGGTRTGDDGRTTLRFAYFSGEATSFGKLWSWWMDQVHERSGGSISFDAYWDATLLKAEESRDGLKDGRVDLTQMTPAYYPGKFPLTSASELPFLTANVPAGAAAMTKLFGTNRDLQREWQDQGLHPVAWNVAPSSALGSKDPVRTVADLRGLKIRGIDRSGKALREVGANLLAVGVPELYGAMERSLINGFYGVPLGFVGPLKLSEVSDHVTDLGIGTSTASALSMSEEGWGRLTPAQRSVIEQVSTEAPAKLAEFDAAAEDASCEALRASRAEVGVLPGDEVRKLREAIEGPVTREWAAEAEEKSLPATAFLADYRSAIADATATYRDYVPGVQRCARSGGKVAR